MMRADYPILEGVFNSTLQIVLCWTIESAHNNIFTSKAIDFFKTYTTRASDISLCNAFIRTTALQNLAQYYLDRMQSKSLITCEEKINLEDLIGIFGERGLERRAPLFVGDLKLITVWRFALYIKRYY